MIDKYCVKCGELVNEHVDYCSACGTVYPNAKMYCPDACNDKCNAKSCEHYPGHTIIKTGEPGQACNHGNACPNCVTYKNLK